MRVLALAVGPFGPWELIILLAALAFLGFWIWMIVDCATNEYSATHRVVWILLLVLLGIVAAPFYFLMRKLPRGKPVSLRPSPR